MRNLWLARAVITGYAFFRYPEFKVPDPTLHLIGMMKDLVEARGARFVVGLQDRDPELEAFLRTQDIPFTSFEDAEVYLGSGGHWTPRGHTLVANRLRSLLTKIGIPELAETSHVGEFSG